MTATASDVKAAVGAAMAIAEAIRELKRVPSGHLYARVCGHMTLAAYESIIAMLVNAGCVRKEGHELVWAA